MRAFMSTIGARNVPRTFGGDLWKEMAEREARAILAVTEPRKAVCYPIDFNARIPKANQNTLFHALAEALAAFVASEER